MLDLGPNGIEPKSCLDQLKARQFCFMPTKLHDIYTATSRVEISVRDKKKLLCTLLL